MTIYLVLRLLAGSNDLLKFGLSPDGVYHLHRSPDGAPRLAGDFSPFVSLNWYETSIVSVALSVAQRLLFRLLAVSKASFSSDARSEGCSDFPPSHP